MYKRITALLVSAFLLIGFYGQIVMAQNAHAGFFGPSSISGGFYTPGICTPIVEAPHNWYKFDENTGTAIADTMGNNDMTLTNGGGVTWAAETLRVDNENNISFITSDSATGLNALSVGESFTIVGYFVANSHATTRPIITIGDSWGTANADLAVIITWHADTLIKATLYGDPDPPVSGGTTAISAASLLVDDGDTVFFRVSYTLNSATADTNDFTIDASTDYGISWAEQGASSSAKPINPNPAFILSSTWYNNISGHGIDQTFLNLATYTSHITDAEMQQIADGLVTPPLDNMCSQSSMTIEGDSLSVSPYTALNPTPGADGWVEQWKPEAGYGPIYTYGAVGGEGLQDIAGDAAADAAARATSGVNGGGDKLILWAGTNDLSGGRSQAQMETDFETIVAAYVAEGFTVYAMPIIPRTAVNETIRDGFNAYLVTNDGSNYTLIDLTTEDEFDAALDENNTTYYHSDAVHLTTAGMTIVKDAVAAAVTWPAVASTPTMDRYAKNVIQLKDWTARPEKTRIKRAA